MVLADLKGDSRRMSDNQNFNNNVLIEVKDLHKAFGDHEVLKGINTTISKGEVVVKPVVNLLEKKTNSPMMQ